MSIKRILCIVSFLVCLLVPANVMRAGDPLYQITHADEQVSFDAKQDALIVGQIASENNNMFSIKLLHVISGEVGSNGSQTIRIPSETIYSWREQVDPFPKVNDFCVVSIREENGSYRLAYGIFKADSGDYQKLRLSLPEMRYTPGIMADIACLERYVNSGGTDKEFSFTTDRQGNSTATLKRSTGEVVQIYPKTENVNQITSFLSPRVWGLVVVLSLIIVVFGSAMWKRTKGARY